MRVMHRDEVRRRFVEGKPTPESEQMWCKNPHCTDPDCPVHSVPASDVTEPVSGVDTTVERLNKLAHATFTELRASAAPTRVVNYVSEILDIALTAIHTLRSEVDRLATENMGYTTRIGELEAKNKGLWEEKREDQRRHACRNQMLEHEDV